MSVTLTRAISSTKLGRAYIPPIAAIYLYTLNPQNEFIWAAVIGTIAGVSAHGYNRALYGEGGEKYDIPDGEEFPRRMMVVLKHGDFSDYPKSIRDLISNPHSLPLRASRIPSIIFAVFSGLGINLVALYCIVKFYQFRANLDLVGFGIIFAIAVFYLQYVIWPLFWSVSNERDNKNPAIDSPDYHRIQEYRSEINDSEHLVVRDDEIDFVSGGVYSIECELSHTKPEVADKAIQLIAFGFVGLVASTDRPVTEIDVHLEIPDNVCHHFTISRDMVSRFSSGELSASEYMEPIFKQIEHS